MHLVPIFYYSPCHIHGGMVVRVCVSACVRECVRVGVCCWGLALLWVRVCVGSGKLGVVFAMYEFM